ncbi:adenosylmethionine decarboxylase [Persicobacter diffluens]|uniref:S-adenosylmethionine decarboxylase proenzyme n=1 Tax=Persicobacter diffluens TaxID=981 RepID=A0AAN5AP71_9BACT|nr:S-adenosylmethionine decarboxylase proenzyme [Persicobacter diffluens]
MNSFFPPKGKHLLLDLSNCTKPLLNDAAEVELILKQVAEESGATIVSSFIHQFKPVGVSGVIVIQESHLSIHTWPEEGFASFDFYSCGDSVDLEGSVERLVKAFEGEIHEMKIIDRGFVPSDHD